MCCVCGLWVWVWVVCVGVGCVCVGVGCCEKIDFSNLNVPRPFPERSHFGRTAGNLIVRLKWLLFPACGFAGEGAPDIQI